MISRKDFLIVATYVTVVIALALMAWIIMTAKAPAAAVSCQTRPGQSTSTVWWRWHYKDRSSGVRCWYPGPRHGHNRHRVREAKLVPKNTYAAEPKAKYKTLSEETVTTVINQAFVSPWVSAKPVRVEQIYTGLSAKQRIDRGFTRLFVLPTNTEDGDE